MSLKVLRKMKSSVAAQIRLFPVEFPALVFVGRREDAEIHRAHVERAHLGLGLERCGKPLLELHVEAAAGRDVDDRVGRLLDARQELHEDGRVGRRNAGLRIARVQMDDGGAGFGGIDALLGDLVRRDRQRLRHGRGVDRAGDGDADDDLVGLLGHGAASLVRLYTQCRREPGKEDDQQQHAEHHDGKGQGAAEDVIRA